MVVSTIHTRDQLPLSSILLTSLHLFMVFSLTYYFELHNDTYNFLLNNVRVEHIQSFLFYDVQTM